MAKLDKKYYGGKALMEYILASEKEKKHILKQYEIYDILANIISERESYIQERYSSPFRDE